MNYITVVEASEKWGISERRIQKLCEDNRIDVAVKFGCSWAIPKNAQKPIDARFKNIKEQDNENTYC